MMVAFEGTDGSGKSTQLKALAQRLRTGQVPFEVFGPHGNRPIRALYGNLIANGGAFPSPSTSVLLALADYTHAFESQSSESPAEQRLRLWDRFTYAAAADAVALGLPPPQVLALLGFCPAPDLYIVIDVDPEAALQRKSSVTLAECGGPEFVERFGSERSAFVEFQGRVREAYRSLAPTISKRSRVVFVDGSSALDAVQASIAGLLREQFPKLAEV